MNMITRGSIYMASLPTKANSSVQGGYRPVLVVQNDSGNIHAPTVQIIPLTSRCKKMLPVHTQISGSGLAKKSIALTEQMQTVDKSLLHHYIGSADEEAMSRVNYCIMIQLGLVSMMH